MVSVPASASAVKCPGMCWDAAWDLDLLRPAETIPPATNGPMPFWAGPRSWLIDARLGVRPLAVVVPEDGIESRGSACLSTLGGRRALTLARVNLATRMEGHAIECRREPDLQRYPDGGRL